jgi:hypothetical protein
MEVGMTDRNRTPEEIQAWINDNNSVWLQRELDFGPEEFRYQILAALLADGMRGFERKRLDGCVLL